MKDPYRVPMWLFAASAALFALSALLQLIGLIVRLNS
jgi:hypothetical protein